MNIHYPISPTTGVEDATQLPWTNGIPATGTQGSFPPFETVVYPMQEVVNTILAAGLTASDGDLTQLLQAIMTGLNVGTFGGGADALTGTIPGSVVIPTLIKGMAIRGTIATANATTAPTVAITGFTMGSAATKILKRDGTALAAGDLLAGVTMTFRFDGTYWRIEGMVASDGKAADNELMHWGVAGGTSAAITTTLTPVPSTDTEGLCMRVYMGFTNGEEPMLDFGFGAKPIVLNQTGELLAGSEMTGWADLIYNGSSVELLNPLSDAAGSYYGVLSGTNTTTTTFTPAVAAFGKIPDGSIVVLYPSVTNTGNVTVNAAPLLYVDGASQMLPGELQSGQPIVTVKLGNNLLLRSPAGHDSVLERGIPRRDPANTG